MNDRARRVATGFAASQVGPGDRVAVMMSNCLEVGVSYRAAWQVGAVVVPIMFLMPPDEIRRILAHCEPKVIVTTTELLPNVMQASAGLDINIITTGEAPNGVTLFASLLENEPAIGITSREDEDLAAILYTGGTTGASKGVMLSHKSVAMGARSAYEAAEIPDGERAILTLPLAHGYGLMSSVAITHSLRPVSIVMRWFEPGQWLQLVSDHKVRRSPMVPTMLRLLLAFPLEDHDLSSLEVVNVGAAPASLDTIAEFQKRVPSCRVLEGYGLTESGVVATTNQAATGRPGSVGRAMPHYEIKVVDEQGIEVAVNEPGEVCIRSEAVMTGYYKSPDETAAALHDGWLYSGDIGRKDEDGFVWIVDRKKDLIIRGGFNVFPRDVEDALLEHPAVEIAGVIGRPDETYGEEVVAFVSLRAGHEATQEALIEHSKSLLGKHKYPREVRVVGYIPLTMVGKVDRKALRGML